MLRRFCIAAVLMALCGCLATSALLAAVPAAARQTIPFDTAWHFTKGDPSNAQSPSFDDRAWQTVDVPHDWSIEGPFDSANPTGGAGAFLPAGVGWYRKSFVLPPADSAKRVFVELDGVMANSEVWINGFSLGRRPNGYVGLRYELTPHVKFGAANLLAVRADNSRQPASRWYEGAGIYRHVRLVVLNPVHIVPDSIFITTAGASAAKASVRVRTSIEGGTKTSRVSLHLRLVDPNGKLVATKSTARQPFGPGKSAAFDETIPVANPKLWDTGDPREWPHEAALYRLEVQAVSQDGQVTDEEGKTFGIRDFRFDPATGFWLNGRNLKIKGVCLHQDAGGFGIAVPARLWHQRLYVLKSLGANAVRTAHCPPSPEFLEMCDRLGILVMDEMFDAWTAAKEPYDYHLYFREWSQADLRDAVLRDRNHPSVILYSAGNEIRDTPKAEAAKETLAALVAAFHKYDPTRPVTQALFRPNSSHDYDDGLADLLDVVGQNYRENELIAAHEAKPSRAILGTETTHDRKSWIACRDTPAFAGQFLWTGIDYLGESRRWPVVGASSGLLDRIGTARPLAFQRQSWWSPAPMVSIARRTSRGSRLPTDPGYEAASQDLLSRPQTLFSDWTPANLAPHEETVEVYSNCPVVTLFLNGKPVGEPQDLPADGSPRIWKVPFEPGALSAEGSSRAASESGLVLMARTELRTAGPPSRLVLDADNTRIDGGFDNVTQVHVRVVDASGTLVPSASDLVTFAVTGPARIAAVDNGDNTSHEPFQAAQRHVYHGICVAYLTGSGGAPVTLTASAPGLPPASIRFNTPPARQPLP